MLLEKLKLDSNTIYVFDKGYNDYKAFRLFTDAGTGFVTRIKNNAVYDVVEENFINDNIHFGVEKDEVIVVTIKENKREKLLKLRKVQFYDRLLKRRIEFITNLFDMRADLIVGIYKLRWQIELLFKQLK